MKIVERISFFVFILAAFTATIFNMALSERGGSDKYSLFDHIDGVSFEIDEFTDPKVNEELAKLRDSASISLYSTMIRKSDPRVKFYGFLFMLNTDKKAALKQIPMLLLSDAKVLLYHGKNSTDTVLGYTIARLIQNPPSWLYNRFTSEDIANMEKEFRAAYTSQLAESYDLYKILLTDIINKSIPSLSSSLFPKEIVTLTGKSLAEKLQVTLLLSSMSNEKKLKLAKELLNENDNEIIINTLNSITETDSKSISSDILPHFTNSNTQVSSLAIKKYSLLTKLEGLKDVEKYLLTTKNLDLILVCLDQIKLYGDETYYEMLKPYLTSYNEKINIKAIEAIEFSTYKSNPSNVMRTMGFLIGFAAIHSAEYAIKFHIRRGITANHTLILERLNRREDKKMKFLAIEYVAKFNLKTAITLIETLSQDSDIEVQEKARELTLKLSAE